MKADLEAERGRFEQLKEKMQERIDTQELKFQEIQEQVDLLAQASKQAKQEKEQV